MKKFRFPPNVVIADDCICKICESPTYDKIGICFACLQKVPDHIPYEQSVKYLLKRRLK